MMDVLDEDELGDLQPLGSGKYSPLYKTLIVLKVGQGLVVYYSEWKVKYSPYSTIRKVEETYNRKFEYGRHPNGEGWLVKRLK